VKKQCTDGRKAGMPLAPLACVLPYLYSSEQGSRHSLEEVQHLIQKKKKRRAEEVVSTCCIGDNDVPLISVTMTAAASHL
jgi:superfamily I DNA/RNA helicase